MIHEEIVNFGKGGAMCGIFTPAPQKVSNNSLCIIFLNAGLIHKIGPNRIYKRLSENYAKNGFPSFRLDFAGLGDSGSSNDGISNGYEQINELKIAMNWLRENKGIDRFLLSGICSGAKIAWDESLEDPRVIGLCLIDGVYADEQVLKAVGGKANQRLRIRYYKKNLFNQERWLKLLSGKSKFLSFKNIAYAGKLIILTAKKKIKALSRKNTRKVGNSTVISWENTLLPWKTLFERGVKIQMIFCEGGIAVDIYNLTLATHLIDYQKRRALQTIVVNDVDHTFTPIWSQNHLSNLTTSWLKSAFEAQYINKTHGDLDLMKTQTQR
jgi:hypothetical protein